MFIIKKDDVETFRISGEDMVKIYEERVKAGEIDPNEHASLDETPQWIKDIGTSK